MRDASRPPLAWTRFASSLEQPRLRLLCLPYAGGGASAYRTWGKELEPDRIEVWPIQLPGREERFSEDCIDDMRELMACLLDEFAEHLMDPPYALFGHSMGAWIACRLADEVRAARLPEPVYIFLGAHRPPRYPEPGPPKHTLPDDAFVEKLRRYQGGPMPVLDDPHLRAAFLPKVRADFALLERDRGTALAPLHAPVTVLGGTRDETVPIHLLPYWAEVAASGFRLAAVPGGHLFLLTAATPVLAAVRDGLTAGGDSIGVNPGTGLLTCADQAWVRDA